MPLIDARSPVLLYINDVRVESETFVNASDRIRWEIERTPLFEIKVSEDKLTATLQLFATNRNSWRLADSGPAKRLTVTVEVASGASAETVRLADVTAALVRQSIRANVNLVAIQLELVNPTYRPIVIASGKPAISGKDAKVETFFAQQVENRLSEVNGTVDFRNHLQIPSVQKGEVIAKKTPVVEGLPGYDVYGSVIGPEAPRDIKVVARAGVEFTDSGEVIALREGRPVVSGGASRTFDISTAFIVPGNVDMEMGNIVFSGDVIVYGSVTDNMVVEAHGNVYVYGSVYNSTITATGSVHINGNVIGAKLSAGYTGIMFNRLFNASGVLIEHIEGLLTAAGVLETALKAKNQVVPYEQIVSLLLGNKLKIVPVAVKELLQNLENIEQMKQDEMKRLKELSEVFVNPAKLTRLASRSFIQTYLELLRTVNETAAKLQEEHLIVSMKQCHNSDVKSMGDIAIMGEGVLTSTLYAAKNIAFANDNAICRGSQLEAGDSVHAKIVGGHTGAQTVIRAAKQVNVKRMFSGKVCVGAHCEEIVETIEERTFQSAIRKREA